VRRGETVEGTNVDNDGIRFSFRSLSLSPSLFLHTQNQNALPYLAEVAEQHTLPVGCSRRFHGL